MEFFLTEEEEEEEDGEENGMNPSSSSSPENLLLDENGFPSLSHSPSSLLLTEEEEEEIDYQGIKDTEEEDNGSIQVSNVDSFASDFYRSGTDWSCLTTTTTLVLHNNNNKNKTTTDRNVKLKQTDLFQLWGLNNNKPQPTPNNNTISSSSSSSNYRVSNKSSLQFAQPPLPQSSTKPINNNNKNKRRFGSGSSNTPQQQQRRACPFYKKIPGTPFTVDAFRYGLIQGCSAYFLSHFHYDHYGGLTKGWSHGPIYCTPLTARLVRLSLSVNPSFIRPLELDTEYVIEGTKVTMLEANHCPGAALIYFHLADGRRLLHTGDFRACKRMQSYPLLVDQRVHLLYLDTTYCNPKYTFPPIEDVLSFVVKVTRDSLKKQPKTLVIVGAYSIGKERVYMAISEALGVKIYANASRRRILQSFDWPELSGRLCSHVKDTPLHVLPISSLRHETLKQYLETNMHHYQSVLAFRPTGWTYSGTSGSQLDLIKPSSRGNITIYGVPYSEHSSFSELREFVQFMRPEKIIPTVNIGNAAQRDKMQSYFREWLRKPDASARV